MNSYITLMSIGCVPAPFLESTSNKSQPDLLTLLKYYVKLFDEPISFPPVRQQDQNIPFTNVIQTIRSRPYMYPMIQKNEIERMMSDMKYSGIIRDNNNFFVYQMIHVKKKYGS